MLSDMEQCQLESEVEQIKEEIVRLGPARPGTLYQAHSMCGKPGCACGRKKKPVKHGPYHYLSYTLGGKSYTEFVSEVRLAEVQGEVANYHRLMELVKELVAKNIERSRLRKEKT